MDRHGHASAPTADCPSCGWPGGPTCAHCGHHRGTVEGSTDRGFILAGLAGQDAHPDPVDLPFGR